MNRPGINEIKKTIVEMVNSADYNFNAPEFHCETNLNDMWSLRVNSKDGKTGTAELVYRYPVEIFRLTLNTKGGVKNVTPGQE